MELYRDKKQEPEPSLLVRVSNKGSANYKRSAHEQRELSHYPF
jgi:hypothetical protein